jgi:hypothetical protein
MAQRRFMLAAVVLTLFGTAGVSNADIIHRWSFNGDATDSVGGADAVLMGHATVDSSQLHLDGTDSYAVLPIGGDLLNLTNCTFEGWATWNAFPVDFWERIFDLGNGTDENIFLTPRGGNQRFRFAITIGGGGAEEQTISGYVFPSTTEAHFAVTIDADNGIHTLYLNGMPAAISYGCVLNPSVLDPPMMNNYLGKSQYPDPYFNGSINEFRIYNTTLSADDIAASFADGPDA